MSDLDLDAIEARAVAATDDAEFITHARTDIPALIAEVRHLRSVTQAALMAEEFQRRRLRGEA